MKGAVHFRIKRSEGQQSNNSTRTLPKTNIARKHDGLEDEFPFREGFLTGAMLVSGRVRA